MIGDLLRKIFKSEEDLEDFKITRDSLNSCIEEEDMYEPC